MQNDKNKIRPLAIVFGAIWLMISLQEGWGGDYDSYEMFFDQLKGQSFSNLLTDDSHGEIGYKVIMSLMPSVHAGLVVGIGIWCFSMAFFFYHFIPQKWWWFAILFVFFDRALLMGMVASFLRMAIANTFLIFAVYGVLKDKRWLSLGFIIMGSFFHKSILFMLPLLLVSKKYNKLSVTMMIGIFVIIGFLAMISPSSWFDIVNAIVNSTDALSAYSEYLEDQQSFGSKGIVLIILFYWIYWLSKITSEKGFEGKEYLVMYYALFRIAFDLLPAVGFASRFYYYMDIYFFAGMMCLMNRLPKNDIHRYGIALTQLIIFWYDGFRLYAASEFYQLHWATYSFIF